MRLHPTLSIVRVRGIRGGRVVGIVFPCAALGLYVFLTVLCSAIATAGSPPAPSASASPSPKGPQDGLGGGEDDPDKWRPEQPRGPLGEDWRRVDERMWTDARLKQMDFGPVLGGTCEIYDKRAGQGAKLVEAFSGLCIAVGERGQGHLVYEKTLAQCQGGWWGGVEHNSTRFGLFSRPANAAAPAFVAPAGCPWANRQGSFDAPRPSRAYPVDRAWLDWKGIHFHGRKATLEYTVGTTRVLEHPWAEEGQGTRALTRSFDVAACDYDLWLRVQPMQAPVFRYFGEGWHSFYDEKTKAQVVLIGGREGASEAHRRATLMLKEGWIVVKITARDRPTQFKLLHGTWDDRGALETLATQTAPPTPLHAMPMRGTPNWPQVMETRVETERLPGSAYVLDHLLPPIKNPWRALCYFSGVDFLPDGRAALCSAHGDVWLVDRLKTDKPAWKRFATGLYQPLGLKVVDGEICVIERGQVTRVRDTDGDGEADFLEKVNNRWHSYGAVHAFDMGLEYRDGFFYFNKSGEWGSPNGASILKVPRDGSDARVFVTGLRHTNGLGMTAEGRITCAGQQGNWTPSSRVDVCREGGFYGLLEGALTAKTPLIFEEPLAWLPMDLDSSSADQVTAPAAWGPLGGEMLHLSWGQCSLIHLMPQEIGGVMQAAACRVNVPRTLSGCARGRFSPHDGQLYLACLNGWQCRNTWDGALERVRFVGGEEAAPLKARVLPDGVEITFGAALDREAVLNLAHWKVSQWNYWWSSRYGSDDYTPRRRGQVGRDALKVAKVDLSQDRRTVRLTIGDWQPAMQTRVVYALKDAQGRALSDAVDFTIHRLPVAPEAAGAKPLSAGRSTAPSGDAEVNLSFKPKAGGRLEILLRESQQGATGYRLVVGDGACELTDVWRQAHPRDGLDDKGKAVFPLQPARAISAAGARAIQKDAWTRLKIRVEGRWVRVWVGDLLVLERVDNDTRAALFGSIHLASVKSSEIKDLFVKRLP
jgi:hypothetical protein